MPDGNMLAAYSAPGGETKALMIGDDCRQCVAQPSRVCYQVTTVPVSRESGPGTMDAERTTCRNTTYPTGQTPNVADIVVFTREIWEI